MTMLIIIFIISFFGTKNDTPIDLNQDSLGQQNSVEIENPGYQRDSLFDDKLKEVEDRLKHLDYLASEINDFDLTERLEQEIFNLKSDFSYTKARYFDDEVGSDELLKSIEKNLLDINVFIEEVEEIEEAESLSEEKEPDKNNETMIDNLTK